MNLGAQGPDDMTVTPTGNRGNFFDTQNRGARRQEWLETWSLVPFNFLGAHLVKLGTMLTGSSNQGQFAYRPVDILNAQGIRTQRITFLNQLPFNRTDLEVTAGSGLLFGEGFVANAFCSEGVSSPGTEKDVRAGADRYEAATD